LYGMRRKLFFILCLAGLAWIFLLQITAAQATFGPAAGWDAPFRPCWFYETAQMSPFPPVTDRKETVFLPQSDGILLAINTRNGETLWRTEFGGEFVAQPFYTENRIFLFNRVNNEEKDVYIFRSVSAQTGITQWQKVFSFEKFDKSFVLSDDRRIFLVTDAGQFLALEYNLGNELWRRFVSIDVTAEPVIREGRLITGSSNKKVLILSTQSGDLLTDMDFPYTPTKIFPLNREILIVGDLAGNISALRTADRKQIWKSRAGAQIVDINPVGDNLLISSYDGFVYFLSAKNGNRLWKKRLAGRILGKPLLSGNFVLLQTIDGETAPVLDLSTGKLVNQILFTNGATSENGAVFTLYGVLIPTSRGLHSLSPNCSGQ
jgi:outer membrane protein assembly factor BamB